ncbi:hypothetical protein Hanom_Chr01g00038051 [Helianthus anomalus]
MNIITCLVLNKPYNISQVIFNHMVDNVKGEKYIMYPRFIQMLLDDQVPNLPKDPKDELKLNHMNTETLNRLNKYKGLSAEQEPQVKRMIGKIAKPHYVAPEYDHWRHAESNSEDETGSLRGMTEKKLRFWYEKDEKKRKRTPKISLKVVTPKVVIKGKVGKGESQEKLKSPPRLVDETVIPPTDLIMQGAKLLNKSLEKYLKYTADEAVKAAVKAQGSNVDKEAKTTTKNVEVEGVKETLVEGVVESDSSATESDEVDPTMISPTSYVSGKKKLKRSLKKKKDSDEEDSTYIPTLDEKKKLRLYSSSREVEKAQSVPEIEKIQSTEVETKKAPESPIFERVEKEVEVEFMGERQSIPPPPPINPTIHIHDDPKDPSQPQKDTTSGSSHGFPRVQGEYLDDLPEGDYDLFNEGKINVLTKKLKEKFKAVKAENAELKKVANDHVDIINQLSNDLEEHAKEIDRITAEFNEVNENYETMNETNKTLHQIIGELHETSLNENKVLRQEIEDLRADK